VEKPPGQEAANHDVKLFQAWQGENEDLAGKRPVALADHASPRSQFIVKRNLPEEPNGRSIIAGYHWFGDGAVHHDCTAGTHAHHPAAPASQGKSFSRFRGT